MMLQKTNGVGRLIREGNEAEANLKVASLMVCGAECSDLKPLKQGGPGQPSEPHLDIHPPTYR